MIEHENQSGRVSYDDLLGEVRGKLGEEAVFDKKIDEWRFLYGYETFPKRIDYKVRGGDRHYLRIEWSERSVSERVVWLGLLRYGRVHLEYRMKMEEVATEVVVDDFDKVFETWYGGCFSGEDLDEAARYLFLKNQRKSLRGQDCDEGLYDLETEGLEIEKLEISFPL